MPSPFTLFEVSWEVCNKIGGIHTVLSTKARTLVERFGDDYLLLGPWLLSENDRDLAFEEEPVAGAFAESCRQAGVPVRVGRWMIPGRPRTILVDFSRLYERKDAILSKLWEDFSVDSIAGGWDYVEPVLFGHAAGMVIERWWDEHLAPYHRRAVLTAHEWMTGSALLYLKPRVPAIGTVFTTHATVLGRTLSSLGQSPDDGLEDLDPTELAEQHGVVAKHSIEGVCARAADVFTTVSEVTAKEAELLHDRAPAPLTFNGIDLGVIDELASDATPEEARARLERLAGRFLGADVSGAMHVATSGRYEFHNKGFDVLIEALQRLNGREGRPVVAWFLVPAGNSGLKGELKERLQDPEAPADGAVGTSTHNLFDEERDAIREGCLAAGLDNRAGARVLVVHLPVYLRPGDGVLDLSYEAAMRAMDLSCFPSYYEPWGYTPQESLALGVPTVTSDYAGFGRWAREQALTRADGVEVLSRVRRSHEEIVSDLDAALEGHVREPQPRAQLVEACRASAARTAWTDFAANYQSAFEGAIAAVQERLEKGVQQTRRPKLALTVRAHAEAARPRLIEFDVSATLPAKLVGLEALAGNFWWCWDPEAPRLFEELSPSAWKACGHRPIALLRRVPAADLAARAGNPAYVARLERVVARMRAYLGEPAREIDCGAGPDRLSVRHPIAYFSAEFGVHESMPIYSGGLGVLAGDHLKSSSDLGLPLIAVGMFYAKGYALQRVSPAGEQISLEENNDPRDLPLELLREPDGSPLEISLELPGRRLYLRAWRARIGRVPLYLLDAACPANRPEDREITSRLYGGDSETRIQQEIVLGRGGFRLLQRLDVQPAVYHLNEGHAAFLGAERVAHLMRSEGMTPEEARELVRSTTLFTTHTPVPAGHDRFSEDLVRRYFSDASERLGVPWERFYALGLSGAAGEEFNMTYLALHFASICNGVSKLHGVASRKLLHPLWPGLLEDEVPVTTVTNGIHLASWTDPTLAGLLGAGERGVRRTDFAEHARELEDGPLWQARHVAKSRLLAIVAARMRASFLTQHDSPLLLTRVLDGLDPDALWIGFARRFAPYKRAHLLFRDLGRLRALLEDEERPVRVIVAGKAHPADERGKEILSSIVAIARRDEFAGKVIFVEGYDIELGRALVQGVDVWLNNPTRMQEASGTSGMKAAANGGLNLSIGDGWWPEGYDGQNGWRIGDDRAYSDQALQDQLDSEVLYRLLEEEIVPLFHERDAAGRPPGWLARVRDCLATIPPEFSTDRMVEDYLRIGYVPLAHNAFELVRDRKTGIQALARERARVRRAFEEVEILEVQVGELDGLKAGDAVELQVELKLGSLAPEDVVVELVLHGSASDEPAVPPHVVPLASVAPPADGRCAYEGSLRVESAGPHRYGVRVRPASAVDPHDSLRDLVRWA